MAVEDSLTIKHKKEHAEKFAKTISKHSVRIQKVVEPKNVLKAVKALREFSKKVGAQDLSKKLLQDEDDSVTVTFTLTEVPKNPTPKPL